jgi:phosphatidylinositol alpha-1,6-mannosyltransferase
MADGAYRVNPPRALMTTQCFPPRLGGIETVMAELAAALCDLGWAVDVLADAPGAAAHGAARVRRFAGPKPLRRWMKGRALAQAAADRPALVIADSWKSLEAAPARAPGGPRVLCLAHGMEYPPDPATGKAARIRAALAKADAVSAASRFAAGLVAPHAPAGRVRTVNPGVRPPAAPSAAALAAMAARLGPGPVVAGLGRLEARKGFDMALRAAAALAPEFPGLTVALAGDGRDRARLEALPERAALGDRAVFLGRVDEAEKAALLAAADVFAMPSRRVGASVEGFGLVYLEAAALGTPALGGIDGGARDAVRDGETGLLCDGADAGAVTAALRRLLADDALRARLGAAARRRALEEATWPAVARAQLAAAGLGADGRTLAAEAA